MLKNDCLISSNVMNESQNRLIGNIRRMKCYFLDLFLKHPISPPIPKAVRIIVAGSGTGATLPTPAWTSKTAEPFVKILLKESNVNGMIRVVNLLSRNAGGVDGDEE